MALYSFNHESFGKTSARAGAAGDNARYNADLSKTQLDSFLAANARALQQTGEPRREDEMDAHLEQLRRGRSAADNAAYNARREAAYAVLSHIIPPEPEAAKAWFDAQEKRDRKNARMSDRFIAALPRELNPEQCLALVEDFCRTVTQDRIPWHFALHLELEFKNEPDWNPHAHIIFRDRDIQTGRRFLYTSASRHERERLDHDGIQHWSTKHFRVAWNDHVNRSLERAGFDIRVDHRSYKDRGLDRVAQIHEGRAVRRQAEKGERAKSNDNQVGWRVIPYRAIDNNRSRVDYNAEIRAHNAANSAANESVLRGDRKRDTGAKQDVPTPHIQDPHIARSWQQKLAEVQPRTEQDRQHIELSRAQSDHRRSLYTAQKADRLALSKLHSAQRADHRAWKRQVGAAVRQSSIAESRAAFEQRCRDLFGMPKGPERDAQAAALQKRTAARWNGIKKMPVGDAREAAALKHQADTAIERHAIYGMAPSSERDAARRALNVDLRNDINARVTAKLAALQPAKDKAWRTQVASCKHDRQELKTKHGSELASMARQHASEHAAIAAHWHGERLREHAEHAKAAMGRAKGGMEQQQTAAFRTLQAIARAATGPSVRPIRGPAASSSQQSEANWPAVAHPAPNQHAAQESSHRSEAACAHHIGQANKENIRRGVQRQLLDQLRGTFIARAQAVHLNAAARANPKERSKAGVAAEVISRAMRDEPQKQAGDAARNGRTLTTAERANAPPSVRARLDARERRSAARQIFTDRKQQAREQGRDRGGGGGRNR